MLEFEERVGIGDWALLCYNFRVGGMNRRLFKDGEASTWYYRGLRIYPYLL